VVEEYGVIMSNKLLIIDDEEIIHESIEMVLEDEGIEIINAYTGKEGLEQYYKHKPQMIILDLKMPEMDGASFLKEVQLAEEMCPVVLVLTGHGQSDEVTNIVSQNVNCFMKKPFKNEVLREKVLSVFNS
jgi:DNA-binding NtrC family response regulator